MRKYSEVGSEKKRGRYNAYKFDFTWAMLLYIDEGYNGRSQTDEDVLLIADSLAIAWPGLNIKEL